MVSRAALGPQLSFAPPAFPFVSACFCGVQGTGRDRPGTESKSIATHAMHLPVPEARPHARKVRTVEVPFCCMGGMHEAVC
jgi:hypothetical protein